MADIAFSISERSRGLFMQAKKEFNRNAVQVLSDAEMIAVFSKMLAIEEADDSETEQELKEEIGWYDEDCHRPGSTFQKFLNQKDAKVIKPKKKPKTKRGA